MTSNFSIFRSRRDRVPVLPVLKNLLIVALWVSLVIGILSLTIGFIGLWLVKFHNTWLWFVLGFNAAIWSCLILRAMFEVQRAKYIETRVPPARAKELFNEVRSAIPVGEDELRRAKPVAASYPSHDSYESHAMRLECAWCHATLREGTEPVSHGICQPCAAMHFSEEAGL